MARPEPSVTPFQPMAELVRQAQDLRCRHGLAASAPEEAHQEQHLIFSSSRLARIALGFAHSRSRASRLSTAQCRRVEDDHRGERPSWCGSRMGSRAGSLSSAFAAAVTRARIAAARSRGEAASLMTWRRMSRAYSSMGWSSFARRSRPCEGPPTPASAPAHSWYYVHPHPICAERHGPADP